jgi:hypothetical protein
VREQAVERACLCEATPRGLVERDATDRVFDADEGAVGEGGFEGAAGLGAEPFDEAEAEADRDVG